MDHTDADARRRGSDSAHLERTSSLRLPAGPVFLVGAARSGTSLLQRVLALHPDVTYLSNWNQRFPRLPQLTALNGIARVAARRRSVYWFGELGDSAYVYGRKRGMVERMFPNPAEGETFYSACGVPELREPKPSTVPALTAKLQRAFRKAESWDGDRLMLTKRIANSRRIPLLNDVFPDSRF